MKKEEKKTGDDLEAKLEEAQHHQNEKVISDDSSDDSKGLVAQLKSRIAELEKEKKEFEEIAKRSQYDYLNLKTDFDRYQRQMKESSQNMEVDSLISVVKKILPFIEDLRKSLENITEEHQHDPLTKGVHMVYDKFLKTLEHLHIKAIDSIGLAPDSFLHEPVSIEPVEDKAMQGKIIKEFERGFVYEKDGEKKVIRASKVIIGG